MRRWHGFALVCSLCLTAAGIRSTAAAQGGHGAPDAGVSFETGDTCLACHNGLTAASGEDVSIGVAWRASMMANAARDPYWHAAVRRETIDHPTRRAAIEDECAICHMPLERTLAHAAGRHGDVLALLPSLRQVTPAAIRAADGVSCTLCHQMGAQGLGTRESFVGGFALTAGGDATPRMLGPFDVAEGHARVMQSATGASPGRGDHLRQSEVCATCHTLYTESFGPGGEVVGSLPEQVPYLEWRHSAFARERSCQSCHMPDVDTAPIASVLGEPRDRLARHTFVGGNAFMLRMLNRFRGELAVATPARELEAAAQATIRQLQVDTAEVAITRATIDGGRADIDVTVRNLTGHKLPTGYPSRRVWLHLAVRDGAGAIVFESGAMTADGAIRGNDNDTDASRYEPHHTAIRAADDVQIYEVIMAGPDARLTTGLLQATQYVKDNRLLPRGFDKTSAPADIGVRGGAVEDADFADTGDRVRYSIDLAGARGPFRVEAELRYQTIGYRWAANLRGYDAAEPRRFVSFFEAMAPASSIVLAHATAGVAAP